MLRKALEFGLDLSDAQKHQLAQLNELYEIRSMAIRRTTTIQQQRTKWYDKFIKNKVFQIGDWALLYDSRFKDFKGKLCTCWMGPYEVDVVFDNGTIRLVTVDDTRASFIENGHRLRLHQCLASKDAFIKHLSNKSDLKVIREESSSFVSSL